MNSGPELLHHTVADTPLLPSASVEHWGNTLVVAPHQDDETLGCGGAIVAMCRSRQPVSVVFVSDGSMSHPHSRKYPAAARRALREQEALSALAILGVPASRITFMRQPDTQVPGLQSEQFEQAVSAMHQYLSKLAPDTILLPWRRDPHGDHRAVWQQVSHASQRLNKAVRLIEYPIWIWELAKPEDWPRKDEVEVWRLDITDELSLKKQAIQAYSSQISRLIDDDPEGFMLTKEVLNHFMQPYEIFLESHDAR